MPKWIDNKCLHEKHIEDGYSTYRIAIAIIGTTYATSFTDVSKDHWVYAFVNKLVRDGLVEGEKYLKSTSVLS